MTNSTLTYPVALGTFDIGMARSANNYSDASVWGVSIDDLHEPAYKLKRSIPCVVRRIGNLDFEASFEAANIAIGGTSWQDAFQALLPAILDTFDTLRIENHLGPSAKRQLAVLSDYIALA